MTRLEIAVTSLDDAVHAQQGGANSVEISHDLSVGGLTPSLDLVRAVRDTIEIDIQVIVRPHARDFVYTPDEINVILEQIQNLSQIGVTGLVFGTLSRQGSVDIPLMRKVVRAAENLPVTLHRALDESRKPGLAIEALVGIVPRILTAGPAPTAWEGREGLRRWVLDYGQDFRFVASGGIKMEHLAEYAAYVRAPEYHIGSAARTNGIVDSDKVKRLLDIIRKPR